MNKMLCPIKFCERAYCFQSVRHYVGRRREVTDAGIGFLVVAVRAAIDFMRVHGQGLG